MYHYGGIDPARWRGSAATETRTAGRKKREGAMTAQEFRKARRALGMTQQQLAEKLGIDVKTVKRYESETEGCPIPPAIAEQVWELVCSGGGKGSGGAEALSFLVEKQLKLQKGHELDKRLYPNSCPFLGSDCKYTAFTRRELRLGGHEICQPQYQSVLSKPASKAASISLRPRIGIKEGLEEKATGTVIA
jgi:DNA-binding transcriptional regulator YiaG